MNLRGLLLFFALAVITGYSQEICDNGIDDDGDGLIDLNDDECDCEGLGDEEIESLIPNPSFEEMLCCPGFWGELSCAEDWIQASFATSDYYNLCGIEELGVPGYIAPELPLPDGEGFAGFASMTDEYLEYIGAELTTPLLAGTEYTLNLSTAWSGGREDIEFCIYGTPIATDLPWFVSTCPVGIGSWELLTSSDISYVPDGSWMVITLTFTPAIDIYAIALGGACDVLAPDGELTASYYYVDNLTLIDSESFSNIAEIGTWCDGDLSLEASIDLVDGAWQWFLDGVALAGETSETIDVMLYGLGDYSAVYTIDDNCKRSDHTVGDGAAIEASFEFNSVCLGEETVFTNTSEYGVDVDPEWNWDFEGDGSSTDENPTHLFTEAGIYSVELIALNDVGCNDTIEIDVTIHPTPLAKFEFVIGDLSSQDGLTGGCTASVIQFNDLSIIDGAGIISSWDWDFGGDGTSTDENPTHTFSSAGIYTVTLFVESDNGCTSTFELDIMIIESLELELIYNEPTCFGFTDGSVTVNTVVGGEDLIFEIKNSEGEVLNEDNSNTANTLGAGWYIISVNDGSECSGIDSVLLDQPEEMEIDLTIIAPLCYGFETGQVNVDSVYNATGSYDAISYFWNGEGGLGKDSLVNVRAGNYVLTINDANGCSKIMDFEIDEPDSLYFSQFGFEPAYCRLYGYQSGNGVVFGAAGGGTPDYSYLWTNLDNGENDIFSTWGGLNPGNYELTAVDNNGCILTQSLYLDSLNPIAAFTIISDQLNTDCQGTATVEVEFVNNSINYANPNNPVSDTTFFWNLNTPNADWQISHDYFEKIDTIYGPNGNTYYADVCLVAINKNGCTDTACKTITIYEPIAFSDINIFSPNGDGVNDEFTFNIKAASISEFYCVIVNRWGIVMAELNNITDGWDGTDQNGSLCADGVYFYNYEAKSDNGTKLVGQGNVQLIRGL